MERCENCGRPLSEAERSLGVPRCSSCSAGVSEASFTSGTEAIAPELASFWDRLVAYLIDYTLSGVISAVGFFILAVFAAVIAAALGAGNDGAYTAALIGGLPMLIFFGVGYTWFGNALGGTPGKRFTGLGVVSLPDGGQLGLWRGFVRFIIQALGALPLYLGWLWSIWDPKKQAWHDKAARSIVVREPVFTSNARLPLSSPVLAMGGAALAVMFVALGVLVGVNVEESNGLDVLLGDFDKAFERHGRQQQNIDTLYDICSDSWTQETALNSVFLADQVEPIEDMAAAVTQFAAYLSTTCSGRDIDASCRSVADAVVPSPNYLYPTLHSEIEVGCLQRLRAG